MFTQWHSIPHFKKLFVHCKFAQQNTHIDLGKGHSDTAFSNSTKYFFTPATPCLTKISYLFTHWHSIPPTSINNLFSATQHAPKNRQFVHTVTAFSNAINYFFAQWQEWFSQQRYSIPRSSNYMLTPPKHVSQKSTICSTLTHYSTLQSTICSQWRSILSKIDKLFTQLQHSTLQSTICSPWRSMLQKMDNL